MNQWQSKALIDEGVLFLKNMVPVLLFSTVLSAWL
jgi:hypothetical protein